MSRLNLWPVLSKIAAALMGLTISLTFSQVILRYVFNNPFAWIEEISRYVFVWIVFLGAALAFRSGSHIKVGLFEGINERRLAALTSVRLLVTSVALVLLTWSGTIVAWRNRSISSYTLPDFPAVLFYAAVPIASLLMLLGLLQWSMSLSPASGKKG